MLLGKQETVEEKRVKQKHSELRDEKPLQSSELENRSCTKIKAIAYLHPESGISADSGEKNESGRNQYSNIKPRQSKTPLSELTCLIHSDCFKGTAEQIASWNH